MSHCYSHAAIFQIERERQRQGQSQQQEGRQRRRGAEGQQVRQPERKNVREQKLGGREAEAEALNRA